eukprot:scaffold28098_cov148-Skeletonema_menzelii.AAC.3
MIMRTPAYNLEERSGGRFAKNKSKGKSRGKGGCERKASACVRFWCTINQKSIKKIKNPRRPATRNIFICAIILTITQ